MLVTPETARIIPAGTADFKEMLSVSAEGGVTTVKINYSSLSLIQACARKSYYLLDQLLKAKTQGSALVFGGAVHKALEIYYSAPRGARTIPSRFEELSDLMPYQEEKDQPEGLLYDCIRGFLAKMGPLEGLPNTDARSRDSGVYLLQNYFKTWKDDPWVVYRDASGPVVERRGEIEVYRDSSLIIILHGTVDVVLQNEQNGVILPADHKTSSRVGTDFYNRLKPNHQYTGYFLIAKEIFGIPGDGFLVNCLQTKARPLTARGTAPNFPRQVTTRTDFDIQEFKDSLVEAVRSYLRWKAEGKWPLGPVDSCTQWGGCEFLEVCQAPQAIRETILGNKFQRQTKDAV